ncbi:MAG: hypothetical protein AB1899_00855 [Pseudomonadota bacterium]
MNEGQLTVALLMLIILMGLLVLPGQTGTSASLPTTAGEQAPRRMPGAGEPIRVLPASEEQREPVRHNGKVVRRIDV